MNRLEARAPDGAPEIQPGSDLSAILVSLLPPPHELVDGEIVVVTSKVVSKAEGRLRRGTREDALPGETVRVVARRGETQIVRNHLGLTMAAAGIDNSNVPPGLVVLLPDDPDASARDLRERLHARTGANVAVVVSDTAGRPWREGQTDIAIGAAGLHVAEEYAGRTDRHGNPLMVTQPAVADELAGLAELATGKLGGRPFSIIRGRSDLVLPSGQHGPGAAALIRAEGGDLFGFGAREAVIRAVRGRPEDHRPFGAPASTDELAGAIQEAVSLQVSRSGPGDSWLLVTVPRGLTRAVEAIVFAHGWSSEPTDATMELRLRPVPPPGGFAVAPG